MPTTLTHRKFFRPLVILVVIAASIWIPIAAWTNFQYASATSHLRTVYQQELSPLVPYVNQLMAGQKPTQTFHCATESYTPSQTQLYCVGSVNYAYNPTPLPASARASVKAAAASLDRTLKAHGWVVDRPQDAITSVEGSLPSKPRSDGFVAGEVPFHKNIGDISCNFEVEFDGPTDGVSPGIIIPNEFSCQQNVTYADIHMGSRKRTLGP